MIKIYPYKIFFVVFFIFFCISKTFAFDLSGTGKIDGSQNASLVVTNFTYIYQDSSSIVVADTYNTPTYRNLYNAQPLGVTIPTGFINLSTLLPGDYASKPYNTLSLSISSPGDYSFSVIQPGTTASSTGTSMDLMAALYAKTGNGVAFDPTSVNTNFVAANDDWRNFSGTNPFTLWYQNTSTQCVTLTLVYFSWNGSTGDVNFSAQGPGIVSNGACGGGNGGNLSGPSTADSQSSIRYQASQLRSAFNTQTVAANFALNYDCNVFDMKGMCISAGGRYTTIDNPGINNAAANVTLGYKVNPNIRIGAYLDQNINISKPTGIDISNNSPLMGLYAVWNKEQSGLGYQVRLANTYQDKDVTSTRTVFDTSEAGSGKSSLKSQSYLAELSYAFQYEDKTLVRPNAGVRYTHLKQKGYTEDTTDTVTDPLTVAALRDKSATALLGIKVNRTLTDKATLTAQLGLEQDFYHKVDNYSATDLNGSELTAVAFNSNIKRTRPIASLGAFYDVTKTQRASATINYQQTPFQSTGSATAYFNYMIGF